MGMRSSVAGVLVAGLLIVGAAGAQRTHASDASPILEQVQIDEANRATILRVLKQQDVRNHARLMGVNLDRAELDLTTLSSDELAILAASARNIERDLRGSDSIVAVSATTLLSVTTLPLLVYAAGWRRARCRSASH